MPLRRANNCGSVFLRILAGTRFLVAISILFLGFTLFAGRCNGQNTNEEISDGKTDKIRLDINEARLLKELAYNTNDPIFNQALKEAKTNTASTQKDFIDRFYDAIQKRKPDVRLINYFATVENKATIRYSTSNDEVITYLRDQENAAINRTKEILRERLIKFGISNPLIKIDNIRGKIIVEYPAGYDTYRIKRLLASSGRLEFYETYQLNEMLDFLQAADKVVKAYSGMDSTPLLSLLFSSGMITQASGEYAIIAYVPARDTVKLMDMLRIPDVKNAFPPDVKWAWSYKPTRENADIFELYALRGIGLGEQDAVLDGDVIANVEVDPDKYSKGKYVITMQMNSQGASDWARITKEASKKTNDKREIGIVLDGRVFTAPTVQNEITNGNSQITGDFTKAEANDLANIMRVGKMPLELTVSMSKN